MEDTHFLTFSPAQSATMFKNVSLKRKTMLYILLTFFITEVTYLPYNYLLAIF